MIRLILKLALILVVGLLGYNYFFGDETEKAQSREIVGKARDLGRDAWDLLRSERQKMREGKYDDALEKLDGLYTSLRGKAEALADSDIVRRVRELERRRQELEAELAADGDEPDAATKRKLDDLTAETEDLMNEMEAKSQPAPQ